jgi:hypothetical protein
MSKTKRNIVTFEPDEDVRQMLDLAIKQPDGTRPWGAQSYKVNQCLRDSLTRQGYAKRRLKKAA